MIIITPKRMFEFSIVSFIFLKILKLLVEDNEFMQEKGREVRGGFLKLSLRGFRLIPHT